MQILADLGIFALLALFSAIVATGATKLFDHWDEEEERPTCTRSQNVVDSRYRPRRNL